MRPSKKMFLNRVFTYSAFVLFLFIAYVFIFIASYGNSPWDKYFATGGSLLLSVVSMYFGYQLERKRRRREREVVLFEKYLGEVSDLAEYIWRLTAASIPARWKLWPRIRERSESLLSNMPSPMRISEKVPRQEMEERLDRIAAILQILSHTSVREIELRGDEEGEGDPAVTYTTFAEKVYNDLRSLIGEAKDILVAYEQEE